MSPGIARCPQGQLRTTAYLFIYLFIDRQYEQGRGRERGRHRIRSGLQAPSYVSTEPHVGLELTNCEIMT